MADPAPPLPPFLALPRELRNIIYSYVRAQEGHVHNAPNLGLLHTHPRLREEYLEAIEKNEISVTISDEYVPESDFVIGAPPDPPISPMQHKPYTLPLDMLFARFVKHVTVLIEIFPADPNEHDEVKIWWTTMNRLIYVLLQRGPYISTLRIGIQCHTNTRLQHHNNTYPRFEAGYFLTSPPPCLEVLQLVQRAEGYRLEQVQPRPGQSRPQHGLVKHGCYVYTRGGTNHDASLWGPADVLDQFELQPYTIDSWNTPLPPSITEHEIQDWREKCGHQEAVVSNPYVRTACET
ncbi:hypothetical protein G6011_06300 [Alternaria panax]|uniref:Uncharacterized protein n=1 Tax=Alternaria panax TaxID=48097 RepID=A0AAD4I806_9PLEO|nr:hypothetical protein G6011_06300 [Alternaria panax]